MEDVFKQLVKAHNERHRAYHTAEHITACLSHLDQHRDIADHPEFIEIALWFHDAIYKPMSQTNEADSADWARRALGQHMKTSDLDWVDRAIRLTKTHDEAPDKDTALMLDIDLSILGAKPDVYAQYTKDIRREYRWIPKPVYCKGRAKVLQHFLGLPRIFKTHELAVKWEEQAQRNIAKELVALKS